MELYIISTPIGNLADITDRAKEVLRLCDLVLCEDTRTSAKLFAFLKIKKKCQSYHKFNERTTCENLSELFKSNPKIALISDAGTPAICDPGSLIIKTARKIGAKVFAVPGACAVTAAASLSGEQNPQFVFLGFWPRQSKEQKELLKKIQQSGFEHFIFYESPQRIVKTLESLEQTKELRVFNDLTKKFEREYVGNAQQVIKELKANQNASLGEYVISFSITSNLAPIKEETSEAAVLADYMTKNNANAKTAIEALSAKGLNKNKLKQAAIKLKERFKND